MNKFQNRPGMYEPSFTLVEILVVISIIGLLAGLSFPAIQGAMTAAKKGKAKAEMQSIITALKAYQAEYGKFPSLNGAEEGGDTWYGEGDNLSGDSPGLFRVLSGSNILSQNPREITFLELPAGSTDFLFRDPWKKKNYAVKLDTSGDGVINYYTDYRSPVLVISCGKNGTREDPAAKSCDDVFSFK